MVKESRLRDAKSRIEEIKAKNAKADENVLQTSAKNDIIETTNTKGDTTNGNQETVHLRDSGKRTGSQNTEGQVSRMESSSGQTESREETARVADREAARIVNEGRKVSASELGIEGGSTNQNISVVDRSKETSSMKKARKEAEARGVNVTFFVGDNLNITDESGKDISARAYIKGNNMYVRADHPLYTSEQLARHELGHDKIAKGEVDIKAVRDKLSKKVGTNNVTLVADLYNEAYAGTNMTAEEIWEECICDSLGEMNIFASDEMAGELLNKILPEISKAAKSTKTPTQTRGSPDGKASRTPNRGRSEEIETMENNRFSRLRKFRDEIPNVWYAYSYDNFYIYSNYSFTDYKILKKVAITDANSQLITKIERRLNEDVNTDSRTIAGWIKSFWSRERLNNRNNGNADRGKSAETVDGVDGESRNSKAGYDSSEGNGNSKVGKASRELDTKYLDAVNRGDMKTAQRMVDEAAKAAGYNYHVYHGTDADFTEFDLRKFGGANGKGEGYGIYLAANREISAPYGKNVIDSYTKFNRLAEGRKKTLSYSEVKKLVKRSCEREAQRAVKDGEYDTVSEALKDTWVSNYVYTYDYSSMDRVYTDVADMLWKENDNDGDIINEVMTASGAHYDYNNALNFYESILTPTTGIDGFHYIWGNKDGSGVQNDIYLAFYSEQIKSADPVTYDDNGNMISLSERFNPKNTDIRYSRETKPRTTVTTGKYEQMKANLSHSKVYSKKSAMELVRKVAPGIRNRSFESLSNQLWEGLNENTRKSSRWYEINKKALALRECLL